MVRNFMLLTDGDVIKNNRVGATYFKLEYATNVLPEPFIPEQIEVKSESTLYALRVVSKQRRKSTTKLKLYVKVKSFHLLMQC